MRSSGKQVTWAAITLIVMLGGFKTHDHLQREAVERSLDRIDAAISTNDAAQARKELLLIEGKHFISPTGRSAFEPRLERITPLVKKLEERVALNENEQQLLHIQARLLLDPHSHPGETPAEALELIKAQSFDDPALQATFETGVELVEQRIARFHQVLPPLATETFEQHWPDLLKNLEELAALNAQYLEVPALRLIGTDRKSIDAKKPKVARKYYDNFLHAQDLQRTRSEMLKSITADLKKIEEYTLLKEQAPEETSALSLKNSRADYDKKIEKLRSGISEAELKMENAALEFIAAHGLAVDPKTLEKAITRYDINTLFLLSYTRLSLAGIQRIREMDAEVGEQEALRLPIARLAAALLEQWAIIAEAQSLSAEPDLQILSRQAHEIRQIASVNFVYLEETEDAEGNWLRFVEYEKPLDRCLRWLHTLIQTP